MKLGGSRRQRKHCAFVNRTNIHDRTCIYALMCINALNFALSSELITDHFYLVLAQHFTIRDPLILVNLTPELTAGTTIIIKNSIISQWVSVCRRERKYDYAFTYIRKNPKDSLIELCTLTKSTGIPQLYCLPRPLLRSYDYRICWCLRSTAIYFSDFVKNMEPYLKTSDVKRMGMWNPILKLQSTRI